MYMLNINNYVTSHNIYLSSHNIYLDLHNINATKGWQESRRMKSNISANGKLVVYIKSTKDVARGEALLHKALNGRATIIDKFVETSVRKNYKPELEKAVKKCNSRAAKLIIPNIGHLPRSLAFCNALMKLEGNDPFIYAIRELNNAVSIWNYHGQQMYLQCIDTIALHSKTAKKALDKKRAGGWKAGNPVNLDEATINATKVRIEQADQYCKEIIPIIREIQRYGKVTLQGIANALMARNIKTRRGKDTWTPMGVSNLLKKAKELGI